MAAQVFSPATLAERWDCSERHVRNLISSGKLPSFRLGGKLFRIKREDVESFECQNGVSLDSEENSASHGTTRMESGAVINSEPPTQKRRPAAHRLDLRS